MRAETSQLILLKATILVTINIYDQCSRFVSI